MKKITLTEKVMYNVAYKHEGWTGQFSGIYLGESNHGSYIWFETQDRNGQKSNCRFNSFDIVFAISCK
jgi:hypothetical protein